MGDCFDLGGDGDTEAFLVAGLRLAAGDLDLDLPIFSRFKFNKNLITKSQLTSETMFIFRISEIFVRAILKTEASLKVRALRKYQ